MIDKFSILLFILLFTASLLGYAQTIKNDNPYIETSGDILLVALPVATFATTLILNDKKGSWQFVKSFLTNQAITFGMKVALNKPRPKDNGDNAFPSGHRDRKYAFIYYSLSTGTYATHV